MPSSMNSILNKGNESLQNSKAAIDITGHNISNAHTEGYSRQSVNLESKQPSQYGLHIFGEGAKIQSITRTHDNFLEGQLRKEIQNQGRTEALMRGLEKLESFFNPDLTATIRDRFTSFQNSLRELSNYPEETSTRVNMIESGKALCQAFNSTHSGVVDVQVDTDEQIQQGISQMNQKLSEIAQLNESIRDMRAGATAEVNDLEDKRDLLIKEIGSMININAYRDKNDQITLRGPNECLLVESNHHSSFTLKESDNKKETMRLVISEFDKDVYTDVTKGSTQGKIGALLNVRDHYAQGVRDTLNSIAQEFANKFNDIHMLGYGIHDMKDLNGRNFFDGINGLGEAAQNLSVDISIVFNPNAISTSMSPHTPGDNVISNNLVKMFYTTDYLDNTTNVSGVYDKMISSLGHATLKAKEDAQASQVIYNKLKAQRESVSGVSLDDEAANLLKYQNLFAASSRLITTADEMFKTILDLKR